MDHRARLVAPRIGEDRQSMTPERWQRIKEILHGALRKAPEERSAFLGQACQSDPSLRNEVDSLLGSAPDVLDDFLKSAGPEPEWLAKGTRLGAYEIVHLLGMGGMGEVYRAHDARLGRDVAVKVVHRTSVTDPDRLRRLEQEARAAAALNHPNILAIYDIGMTDERVPYVVSELLEGCTMRDRVKRGPIQIQQSLFYAVQFCRGLVVAHERGIVHRDLKPENLFITNDGILKILDFGLAKLIRPGSDAISTLTNVTQPGMVMGTAGYMSPEQVRGDRGDSRSDIFAFGTILYELLTGERAFKGQTSAEAMAAILNQEPPESALKKQNVPASLKTLLGRCLQKNPEARFNSGRDLLAELEHVSVSPPRNQLLPRKWIVVATAAVLLITIGLWKISGIREFISAKFFSENIDSIAVLPLENFSGDASQEYFADGMTEALITDLAKIGVPRVISRTSIMQYKGTHKPIPEIAKELGVTGIVEGSVVRSGDRVRVTAQLIFAPKDKHVWADSYDRSLRDILSIENEVSQSIADAIRLKISAEEKVHLASARPVVPEAHEAYLKGRFLWNQRTEPDLKKAINFFQQAIAADPNYAPAYAGLADTYFYLGYAWGRMRPTDAMPLARNAAQKAIELDPNSAEGHASLGAVEVTYEWNFSAAEHELKRSIAINPNYEWSHHVYSALLMAAGRPDESVAEARKAVAVDPLSVPARNILALLLVGAGRYDEAIQEDLKTMEIDPNPVHLASIHTRLQDNYARRGMQKEAFEEHIKTLQAYGLDAKSIDEHRKIFAEKGWRGLTENNLKQALIDWEKGHWHFNAYIIAGMYARLGDKDQVFAWLNKCLELRSTMLYLIDADPVLAPVRSDPRFTEIKRKMGLPT
jgi:eukaryotic-like serine/threonine-protein kinase